MSRTVFSALLLLCLLFVIINPRWVNDVQKVSLIQSGPSVQMVLTSYSGYLLGGKVTTIRSVGTQHWVD